ncbi:MAG: hypothetical protein A2Y77_11885 [Planctomycetes bacterium RBG_13_62_9]|nr:MAG: hypothetical protein A2Y77_11885 [Planctomycetes bacterium RBG_13_62_9]
MKNIGLIGVGLVGTVLARRLLSAGWRVLGYDIASDRRDHLKCLGGVVVGSPAAAADGVDYVLLSLPDTAIVRQVVEGPGGILEAGRLPSYVIDTTTGDPDETAGLAARLTQRGVALLDAMISGSSRQLDEGKAVLMVGGEKAAFDTCVPVLQVFSDHVFYLGPSGSGSKAKLATNLVLGLNRLVLAEGLVFAERLGLDLGSFLELLRAGPAYSAAVDVKGAKMLHGDFTPEARLKQHYKDVSLILRHAARTGQDLPLTKVHADILEKAIDAGEGELDNAVVINEIRRRRTR